MNRQKKQAPGFSNFGFSTILLAFVMICIVTISAVSLMTANSDYNLSKKVAEKTTAYYQAEEQAYHHLAEIDSHLATAYARTSSSFAYYHMLENTLSSLGYGVYEKTSTMATYSYAVPISDNQALNIVLKLDYPDSPNDSFYTIITWQSVYETTIHEDDVLNLMQ